MEAFTDFIDAYSLQLRVNNKDVFARLGLDLDVAEEFFKSFDFRMKKSAWFATDADGVTEKIHSKRTTARLFIPTMEVLATGSKRFVTAFQIEW